MMHLFICESQEGNDGEVKGRCKILHFSFSWALNGFHTNPDRICKNSSLFLLAGACTCARARTQPAAEQRTCQEERRSLNRRAERLDRRRAAFPPQRVDLFDKKTKRLLTRLRQDYVCDDLKLLQVRFHFKKWWKNPQSLWWSQTLIGLQTFADAVKD